MAVERVGVSFEPVLLKEFDKYLSKRGYSSRSEAIRDLVRKAMIEKEIEDGTGEVLGTLTYVYDHHHGDVHYQTGIGGSGR